MCVVCESIRTILFGELDYFGSIFILIWKQFAHENWYCVTQSEKQNDSIYIPNIKWTGKKTPNQKKKEEERVCVFIRGRCRLHTD